MAAQRDGYVIKSVEATADSDSASGGAAKRQQQKRQSKSERKTPSKPAPKK